MLSKNITNIISSQISVQQHSEFDCLNVKPMTGGDINQAFLFQSINQSFFVKINRVALHDMFATEAHGLALLEQSQSFIIPKVITSGVAEDVSFLVLQRLDLSGRADQLVFAVSLASLHQYPQKNKVRQSFGLESDNYIGSSKQSNGYYENWPQFFAEQRLAFQLELLKTKGVSPSLVTSVRAVIDQIDAFFDDYQPLPSLLHGDLWQGNYAFDHQNKPVIYDPACYYGDHEVDLAMLELFGNPGIAFFKAYHQVFAIDKGYKHRKILYNLYHILNHANLFAGGYAMQAKQMADELLRGL